MNKPTDPYAWRALTASGVLDAEDAKNFARTSDEFVKEATKTPEAARAALVKMGILTDKGELMPHLRSD